mmetsp:Transcript_3998/g.14012  ORF Transcript_3998/g.14012 Transcript_3998/m.14012 type:complete len:230 (+) Transcript_3998:421-1110(+)
MTASLTASSALRAFSSASSISCSALVMMAWAYSGCAVRAKRGASLICAKSSPFRLASLSTDIIVSLIVLSMSRNPFLLSPEISSSAVRLCRIGSIQCAFVSRNRLAIRLSSSCLYDCRNGSTSSIVDAIFVAPMPWSDASTGRKTLTMYSLCTLSRQPRRFPTSSAAAVSAAPSSEELPLLKRLSSNSLSRRLASTFSIAPFFHVDMRYTEYSFSSRCTRAPTPACPCS